MGRIKLDYNAFTYNSQRNVINSFQENIVDLRFEKFSSGFQEQINELNIKVGRLEENNKKIESNRKRPKKSSPWIVEASSYNRNPE